MRYLASFLLFPALAYAQVNNPGGGGQINNPPPSLPSGVSAGSVCASNGIGQPCVYQSKPVLDARDFGTPSGSNAGTLIQAAHDSATCLSGGCVIDARGFGTTDTIAGLNITKPVSLLFGATTFSVSATISLNSIVGPRVLGAGIGVTKFNWTGNNSTPMFDLNSVYYGVFSDFSAQSSISSTAIFTSEQAATGLSGNNTFINIAAGGVSGSVVDGFRWQIGSGGDNNNAQNVFINVSFNNYSHAAWNNSTSTQSQAHAFHSCSCNGNGFGQYCYLGQGSFYSYDMFSGGNTVADFEITNPNFGVFISGGFSIGSNRFYVDPTGNATVFPVHIAGVFMNDTAADGKVIEIGSGGPYLLESNYVYGANTVPFQFYYSASGVEDATANNNTFNTSLANPLVGTGWQGMGNVTLSSSYQGALGTVRTDYLHGPLSIGLTAGYSPTSGAINFLGSSSGTFPVVVSSTGAVLSLGTGTQSVAVAGGNLAFSSGKGQHITTQAAANDIVGTLATASSTTASVNFTTNYTATPVCVLTPQTTGLTSWYLSAISNSGFTVTVAPSGTYTFGYHCLGNPN